MTHRNAVPGNKKVASRSTTATIRKEAEHEAFSPATQSLERRADVTTVAVPLPADQDVRLERLKLAVDYAGVGVWEYDTATGVLFWDEAMFSIYDMVPVHPMPYELWESRVLPEDLGSPGEGMRRVLRDGGRVEADFRIRTESGQIRHIHSMFGATPGSTRIVGINVDVSRAVRTEQALLASQERWRLVMEAIGEGVWELDLETGEAFYSSRWKRMLGYEDEDIEDSLDIWERLVHPEDKPGAERAFYNHIKGQAERYETEFRMRCKDGTYKWLLSRAQVMRRDSSGKALRIIGSHMDISARKAMEEDLERSYARLAEAQGLAKLGNWEWEIESGQVVWSDEVYRIFGVRQGDFVPNYDSYLSLVHPEDRQELLQAVEAALSVSGGYSVEHRVITPDKTIRHVHGIGRVHTDAFGFPAKLTGTVQDVTDKVLAEAELRSRDAMLQAMSEAAHDTLIIIDSSDTIILWNKAAEAMFGYSRQEVVGRRFHDLVVPEEYISHAKEGLKSFAHTGTGPVMNSVLEFTAIRKNGEVFPVERAVAPFKRGGRWYAVGSLRDITSRKQTEEKLRELASTDALTGLNNRRHFLELAELAFETARRYGHHLSALMFDIDHFKLVNDTHGHEAGDAVLQALSRTAVESLRGPDVLGRLGGEEFCVIMPETDLEQAAHAAERLRQDVERLCVSYGSQTLNVTVSLGLATMDVSTSTLSEMIRRADDALYKAKVSGRNRLVKAS